MKEYDYLIVGAGLFGAVFAHEATKRGKRCLVIDKRHQIGGNCATEEISGINVHKYGAHIFHTSNKEVYDYITKFCTLNRFTNCPKAYYKGKLYSMPFNMNTFYELFGVIEPALAKQIITREIQKENIKEIHNLEEQALSLVGRTVYETLVKGYTEKQWGKDCKDLPSFIIKRLPIRYTFDNNYFNDIYQGIPIGGYNQIFKKLLENVDVLLGNNFFDNRERWMNVADKIIFTGCIDEYYDYCYGALEYRSLSFDTEVLEMENYQGNAVINNTEFETPYTRTIEHKFFENAISDKTVITREYPKSWAKGDEPYYPVNDKSNQNLYNKYLELAENDENVYFGGRLGQYKYYDMDKTILASLKLVHELLD